MKNLLIASFLLLFAMPWSPAQTSSLPGAYANSQNTVTLRLKSVDGVYQGILQTTDGIFALRADLHGDQLNGTVFTSGGNLDFQGSVRTGSLSISAWGYTEVLYRFSSNHELAGVDLTPYMVDRPPLQSTQGADFDYSYSQQDNGNYAEQYKTYPQQPPQPAGNNQQNPALYNAIAGGQLVYYTRTSYLNDNTASSITYVNFCANGRFQVNYDGSFSVEGDFYGNAQGASYGRHSGTWSIVQQQGIPALKMAYSNGNIQVTPINMTLLQTGRLRVGNTQYAFQRNKVFCR